MFQTVNLVVCNNVPIVEDEIIVFRQGIFHFRSGNLQGLVPSEDKNIEGSGN